jgi:hypothetical protein
MLAEITTAAPADCFLLHLLALLLQFNSFHA